MDLMKLTSNEKNGSRPLDVIYEGINSISNMPNLKQKRDIRSVLSSIKKKFETISNNVEFSFNDCR